RRELSGGPKTLFFPFLGDSFGCQSFSDRKLVEIHSPARKLSDDFRYRHRMIEQVFARLQLMPSTAIRDVRQCSVPVHNDFSLNQQPKALARAEAVRNPEISPPSRAPHNAPWPARVER